MFVRTERLTLRPGWIEHAPEVARASGYRSVCDQLAQVPWPYTLADAEAFLAAQQGAPNPALFIHEHVGGIVHLVGAIGIHEDGEGNHELGYWLTPNALGRASANKARRGTDR